MRDHICGATAARCPHLQHLLEAERQLRDAADLARKLTVQIQDVLDQISVARHAIDFRPQTLEHRCTTAALSYNDGCGIAGRLPPIMALTPREAEILHLIADGDSNRAIADRLFLSPRTVERHIANLYLKLDIHNKSEAIDYARRHGCD